jgi:putative two-component system response regulator
MTLSGNISSFIAGLVHGRDPELGDHHDRAQKLTEAFARLLHCSEDEVTLLGLGARIHDIGKLVVNSHILLKPSRLTASEFDAVRAHSKLGAELLAPLVLDPRIGELVRHHHENYDGTGYPDQLAGVKIPKFAQIMRIVDSFDAITSDRPYHKGATPEEAIKAMRRDWRLYNPAYLDTFLEMVAGPRPQMAQASASSSPA